MNDPLHDNRIFPEEMQEKPKRTSTTTPSGKWLRALLTLILLGIIAFFVYNYLTTKQEVATVESEEERYLEEKSFYDAIESRRPEVNPIERAIRIEQISGSFNRP